MRRPAGLAGQEAGPMSIQLDTIDQKLFEPPPEAVDFYVESLKLLKESEIPFLLSGTYALACFTGISRPTKDLDVFCKPSDAPDSPFFRTAATDQVEDERDRKVGAASNFRRHLKISSASIPITDQWFDGSTSGGLRTQVRVTPPTSSSSQALPADRYRYDGATSSMYIISMTRSTAVAADSMSSIGRCSDQRPQLPLRLPDRARPDPRWLYESSPALKAQDEMPPALIRSARGDLPTD